MQDILLQMSTELEMDGRKVSRKGKRVVQSRDQGNMNLVLVQSYNSSQALYHFVPALLQQHNVVLHVFKNF